MPDWSEDLLNAALLRRISHAIDGMRTGEEVWVVVQPEAPYWVHKVTTSERTAEEWQRRNPRSVMAGPFRTDADLRERFPRLLMFCHMPDSDPCDEERIGQEEQGVCEWTEIVYMNEAEFPKETRRPEDALLKRIRVEWFWDEDGVEKSDHRVYTWHPGDDPKERQMVDSICFTLSAVDHFFLPYITHVQGADFAANMRDKLLERLKGPDL